MVFLTVEAFVVNYLGKIDYPFSTRNNMPASMNMAAEYILEDFLITSFRSKGKLNFHRSRTLDINLS